MAADFSKPLATQSSDDILQQLKDNIESLAKMNLGGVATAPVGTITYITDRFKRKKNDGTWEELPLTLNLNAISSTSIETESIIVQDTLGGVSGGAATGNTVEISGGDITASGNVSANNITTLQNDVTTLKQNSATNLVLGTDAGASNDLNIVKSAGNVSINVPDASETVRGVLTTSNQTLGGVKTLSSKKIQIGNSSTAGDNWHLVGDGYFSISSGNHSSGTERIRIDASGNLGIGITTPSSKLHVAGTARLSPGSSGGLIISAGTIDARYTVSNVLDGAAIETLTNHPIIIRTNDVDRVTISRLGNVGVGISLPTSLLHVHSGDIRVSNANNTSTIVSKTTDRTTISSNTTTNNVVIMDSGSVGVSTAYDPTTYGKFVVGSNTTDASTKNMISMVNASNTDNVALRIAGYNHPESRLQTAIDFIQNSNTNDKSYRTFSTHDGTTISEKVRITAEGSLGIGTSGPLAKLHIFDSSATPYVLVQGQSSTSTPAGSDKSGVLLDVNGKGAFSITNDASSGSRVLKIDSTNGSFTGTTALAIDSSGNVGVGTSTPGSKLQVIGNIAATGDVAATTVTTSESATIGGSGNIGGYITIKNTSKTGSNCYLWRIYNMSNESGGTKYQNALQFWRYPATGGASCSMTLGDDGLATILGPLTVAGAINTVSYIYSTSGVSTTGTPSITSACASIGHGCTGNDGKTYLINNRGAYGPAASGFVFCNVSSSNSNPLTQVISWIDSSGGYTKGSDYRIKTNISSLSDCLNKILNLRPVSYDLIVNNEKNVGFIAHEVQEVIPEIIRGEKDAIDASGNIIAQSIVEAGVIPFLVGAVKELSSKVDSLQTLLEEQTQRNNMIEETLISVQEKILSLMDK